MSNDTNNTNYNTKSSQSSSEMLRKFHETMAAIQAAHIKLKLFKHIQIHDEIK